MFLHPSPRTHSLPFVGQLGKRDGCQKTRVLYLENRDYQGAFYIHKLNILIFRGALAEGILLDVRQLKGRLHLSMDPFSFSLIFVGFWNEHGHRSYLLSSGQALPFLASLLLSVLWCG